MSNQDLSTVIRIARRLAVLAPGLLNSNSSSEAEAAELAEELAKMGEKRLIALTATTPSALADRLLTMADSDMVPMENAMNLLREAAAALTSPQADKARGDGRARVFIDLDGVVVDFDKFRDERGLTGDQVKAMPGAYLDMPAIPGACEAVRSLIGMGYEVWLATKPPTGIPHAYSDKAAWVLKHLPELKRRIIITHDKGLLGCEGDYLCDDRPHKANCERFRGTLLRFVKGYHWPQALDFFRANKSTTPQPQGDASRDGWECRCGDWNHPDETCGVCGMSATPQARPSNKELDIERRWVEAGRIGTAKTRTVYDLMEEILFMAEPAPTANGGVDLQMPGDVWRNSDGSPTYIDPAPTSDTSGGELEWVRQKRDLLSARMAAGGFHAQDALDMTMLSRLLRMSTPQARPDGGAVQWGVCEFRVGPAPFTTVLKLAVGVGVSNFEEHPDFIRWVYTHPAPAPDVARVPDAMIVLLNHLEDLMDAGKLAEDAIPVAMWNAVSMHNVRADADVARLVKLTEGLCQWLLHRFGPDSPEGKEALCRMEALAPFTAAPQEKE